MGWKGMLCMSLALAVVGGGCKRRPPPAASSLYQSWPGWESLPAAAREGNPEAVRLFIAEGAELNAQDENGLTPLHLAARDRREPPLKTGEKSIVQLLLAAGADVDARDKNGATPLHHAAFLGHMRAAKHLLAGGAGVNVRDVRGETPLHEAVKSECPELIERLIAKGADINAVDRDGWTPLHIAAFHQYQQGFDLLAAHGANPEKKTQEGKTAADLVREAAGRKVVVLSDGVQCPYAVIVTDPGATARFLRAHAMDYDRVWIPAAADVEWTGPILKAVLDTGAPVPTPSWFERDYVVEHFSEYNREYSGFSTNGKKHVLCNMYLSHAGDDMYASRGTHDRDPYNEFTYTADGGGVAVRAVFDVEARTVTWVECNGM
jgi:hypothetical protein